MGMEGSVFSRWPYWSYRSYWRNQLEETPAYEAMEKEKMSEHKNVSVKEIVLYYWKPLVIGIALVFFYGVVDYMVLSYMPSHLTEVLGYDENKGSLLLLIVMVIMIPMVVLKGYFSDRIGGQRIIQFSLLGFIFLSKNVDFSISPVSMKGFKNQKHPFMKY